MKFNTDEDFESNFNLAISELDDTDIAEILRNRMNEIILLASSGSSTSRLTIVNDLEDLIKKRITG